MKKFFKVMLACALLIGPAEGFAAAPGNDPLAQLGGQIFRDKNLSMNNNQSCQTCHHPSAGFADPDNRLDPADFPVSDGSDPTKFGGRNCPTAAYTGFSPVMYYDEETGLYFGGMFWDGRAPGLRLGDPLAEQALGPFLNPAEMGLTSPDDVIDRIQASNYASLFLKVFGETAFEDPQAFDNVGRAIAAFERSNQVEKFKSKFDDFWQEQGGDVSAFGTDGEGNYVPLPAKFKSKVYTKQEAEGLALFNAVDKGNCAACHLTVNHNDGEKVYPPLLTDFTYDNLGLPKNPRIETLAGPQPIDYGLGAMQELKAVNPAVVYQSYPTGIDDKTIEVVVSEIGKFKVPTLRNIDKTAPYGHNGYFATLEEITHFYNTRDVEGAGWEDPEVLANLNTEELGDLGLTTDEVAAIVAFMRTLTDGSSTGLR